MSKLIIERVRGGFNPLKGRGEVDPQSLSAPSHAALEEHFKAKEKAAPHGNEPVYRITRVTDAGPETVDLPEHLMPAGLVAAVKDELP